MATVIYNHREMEYNCEKWWKQQWQKKPDFTSVLQTNQERYTNMEDVLHMVNYFSFSEEYAMDYGLDTLRLYLLFEGKPKEEDYREGSLEGIYKFLNRFMTLVENSVSNSMGIEHNERKPLRVLGDSPEDQSLLAAMWTEVYQCYMELLQAMDKKNLHSIVAAFMEVSTNISQISKKQEVSVPFVIIEQIAIMLSPFAPYMSEHVWHAMQRTDSVFEQKWPTQDVFLLAQSKKIDLAIQINGKTKKVIQIDSGAQQAHVEKLAREALQERFPQNIDHILYVPDKIVNIITK